MGSTGPGHPVLMRQATTKETTMYGLKTQQRLNDEAAERELAERARIRETSPGRAYGEEIAARLNVRDALIEERGEVARNTARALGYTKDQADAFWLAARSAARVGLARDGILKSAGRVSISTGFNSETGRLLHLSILTESGAYYDPTKPITPGNSIGGSD